MKFPSHHICNLTFSSFIVSHIGGKKPENIQNNEDFRDKIIKNAIRSAYSYHTHMKSLTLYVGHHDEYCVVFETEKKQNNDPYEPSTAIYWLKGNEISMVNLAWIDIWHLKRDFMNLMNNYQEKVDYSSMIEKYLHQIADDMESKV